MAGSSSAASAAVPACKAGLDPLHSAHPNCYSASWADPTAYGSALTARLGQLARVWVPKSAATGYGHWKYTVTVDFHDPLALCPQPTPISSIPCQSGGASAAIAGGYTAGKPTLQSSPVGNGTPISCNRANTSCEVGFTVYPENTHGLLNLVWSVTCTQLIKQPGNDLGQAGAEFPLSIYVKYVAPPG